MKTFDIYIHTEKGYEAVKQGFSYPAFFFTVIWAFLKRMWIIGIAIFIVSSLLMYIEGLFVASNAQLVGIMNIFTTLAISLVIGIYGNNWRRGNLIKREYSKYSTVGASSAEKEIEAVIKSNR